MWRSLGCAARAAAVLGLVTPVFERFRGLDDISFQVLVGFVFVFVWLEVARHHRSRSGALQAPVQQH